MVPTELWYLKSLVESDLKVVVEKVNISTSSINFVNGVRQDHIPIEDRGFLYGDGLFETMLFENQRIPLIRFHLDRVLNDGKRLGLVLDESVILNCIHNTLKSPEVNDITTGKIRLTLTRGVGGFGCYPAKANTPNVVVQVSEINPPDSSDRVDIVVAPTSLADNPRLAGIKHLNRLDYIIACQEIDAGCDQEILFLDKKQHIIETMHHNIFFVKGDNLVTPKIVECGVAGVMRRLVCSVLAQSGKLKVDEDNIHIDNIGAYNGCFLTNAVRGFIAVRQIGEIPYDCSELLARLNLSFNAFKSTI